jgi:hypothetical protein
VGKDKAAWAKAEDYPGEAQHQHLIPTRNVNEAFDAQTHCASTGNTAPKGMFSLLPSIFPGQLKEEEGKGY